MVNRPRSNHDSHVSHQNIYQSEVLQQSKTILETIATNTANIDVNVGDVEINVQDVEDLITISNDKLDTINTTLTAGGVVDISTLSTHALQTAIHDRQDDQLGHLNTAQLKLVSLDTNFSLHKTANHTDLDNIFSRQDDILTSNNATKSSSATTASKMTSLESTNHTDLDNIFSRQDDILTSNNATKSSSATTASKMTSLESTNHTDLDNIFSRQDDILTSCNATKSSSATTASKMTSLESTNHTDLDNIFSRQDDILTSCNAVKTNTQSVENCVSSNKMNVNISSGNISGFATSALQGTTHTILGDLATENTLNIIAEEFTKCDTGDVTVTSLIPGVAATSLGKAIQSAQGATDTGVATLAVRNDTLADLAGADHDYAPLQVDLNGALYTRSMVTELLITAGNSTLVTIDEDTNAIKNAVESLDNAVDGNYLNVNQNIAGTDVDSNSGNKSAATQRVVIATDDVNLSAIKTAVETIDNAIDGSEMQVDIVASLPAGTNAIGKLSANDGVDIGDVDVTSLPLTFNSGNKDGTCQRVVVATDDVNLSAIKTAVETIDNAIDGSEMQVDIVASLPAGTNAIGKLSANDGVDIGDVDVTSLPLTFNSGNKDATCQRVVIATDDVNLSAIKTAVESLDNAVDGNYLNVNQNIAGTDVDSNSGNKSAASQRVVIATDDVNLSAVKTAVELLGASELKELLSGVTINAGALSSEFDTENYEKIRFFGETTAAVGNNFSLMGSNVSGGTFYHMGESLRDETIGSTHYIYGANLENLPRYIKIINKHGSTNFVFTKFFMQLSGGRLAV